MIMRKKVLTGVIFICLGVGMLVTPGTAADVPRMTKDELKALLGNPNLVILDVRLGRDWKEGELKIKGAVREEPGNVESWASKYSKDKILVLYCA
jgi:hypothetical protein